MIVAIVIAVVVAIYFFAFCLCVAAKRGDRAIEQARTAQTRRHLEVVADALAAPGTREDQ
jgi:hypothetical protein